MGVIAGDDRVIGRAVLARYQERATRQYERLDHACDGRDILRELPQTEEIAKALRHADRTVDLVAARIREQPEAFIRRLIACPYQLTPYESWN